MLAWRVQADAMGGIERKLVRQIVDMGKSTARRRAQVSRGVKVSREWQGAVHEVEVREDGFAYRGKTYRSLSSIAREITGSRWNGPRFFGLRDEAA